MSRDTIGALLAISSAVISNLGVNVQKKSHNNHRVEEENENNTAYLTRPLWWLGLSLVIFGSAGDFIAFGFATQALVASLGGGTTIVANVVIAHYFNHEDVYWSDAAGLLCIIMGTLTVALITEADQGYTLEELESRFVHPKFIIYISIVILCMLSLMATIKGSMANKLKIQFRWSQKRQKRLMKDFEKRFHTLEDRIDFLEAALLTAPHASPPMTSRSPSPTTKTRHGTHAREVKDAKLQQVDDIMEGVASRDHVPYLYAICSGVVGSISVLLAKFLALMIDKTLHGDSQLYHPLTYFFGGGMVLAILLQTHLLNMATILGDTMTVFPIFQAFWISFSVIGGIVFYETDKHFTIEKWVLYPFALILVGVGVLLLVQHEARKRAAALGISTTSLFPVPVEDVKAMMTEALLPDKGKGSA